MRKMIAVVLVLAMLLTGCGLGDRGLTALLSYRDMTYTRPDMAEFQTTLEETCEAARTETKIQTLLDRIYEFYDAYDWFYTYMNQAYIEYNRDMTSEYWQEEYQFCADNSPQVDAGLEELYMALAQSPIREELEGENYFGSGFFDTYEGDSVFDEVLVAMLNQESALIEEYYDLYTQAQDVELYSTAYYDTYAEPLCQLLVDLVALRQQMADYVGYDSYVSFAYDFYYYRDYTPDQAAAYLESIRQELTELYQWVCQSDIWAGGSGWCTQRELLSYGKTVTQAMGGLIAEAYEIMVDGELCDVSQSSKKFSTSFEVYLTGYTVPYLFLSPTGTDSDKMTLAHEFGHFVADYVCYGSYAGIDVMEVFSQGMELLSLCYDDGQDDLEGYKLADCLCTYVEQAAYAAFEQALYDLTAEELTTDAVFRLYEDTCRSFGMDFEAMGWDPRDLVSTPHFYTEPMYIISYVVSNDAAFQLLELERDQSGAGLERYEQIITSQESYFLAFLDESELTSPFTQGRIQQVREKMEAWLG